MYRYEDVSILSIETRLGSKGKTLVKDFLPGTAREIVLRYGELPEDDWQYDLKDDQNDRGDSDAVARIGRAMQGRGA
jgi:hypothetical protein